MHERTEISEYKLYSDSWLIDRYFMAGSVDEALQDTEEYVPFSFADMHRKLENAGIIKSAGRQTSLSEALHFFRVKQMEPGSPLESIYKGMPLNFKTSIATLHRIYNRILEAKLNVVTNRYATALIISDEENMNSVMVGTEQYSRLKYGKLSGQLTIPLTFSKFNDTPGQRVLRVLQQEVFTNESIEKRFSDRSFVQMLLLNLSNPFLKYRLLDVEIQCYSITIPKTLSTFSSYKLSNHHFVEKEEILHTVDGSYREGIQDIINFSIKPLIKLAQTPVMVSSFNISLEKTS